jgi:hypothetical protein
MEPIQDSLAQTMDIVLDTPFWVLFAVGILLAHIIPAIILERLAWDVEFPQLH